MTKTKRKRSALLGERDAWRVVELVFTRPFGICYVVNQLQEAGIISLATLDAMRAAIDREFQRTKAVRRGDGFIWPIIMDRDEPRVEFAQKRRRAVRA